MAQEPDLDPRRRLGYLFKHAALVMEQVNDRALAPFGIGSRELGLLLTLARLGAPSQHEAAAVLKIDRTTMGSFVDLLEGKGLVVRHADPSDRRRNVVRVTEAGQRTLRDAVRASDEAEKELLSSLSAADVKRLRSALTTIVTEHDDLRG